MGEVVLYILAGLLWMLVGLGINAYALRSVGRHRHPGYIGVFLTAVIWPGVLVAAYCWWLYDELRKPEAKTDGE